jgi:hypothetical protein
MRATLFLHEHRKVVAFSPWALRLDGKHGGVTIAGPSPIPAVDQFSRVACYRMISSTRRLQGISATDASGLERGWANLPAKPVAPVPMKGRPLPSIRRVPASTTPQAAWDGKSAARLGGWADFRNGCCML